MSLPFDLIPFQVIDYHRMKKNSLLDPANACLDIYLSHLSSSEQCRRFSSLILRVVHQSEIESLGYAKKCPIRFYFYFERIHRVVQRIFELTLPSPV
jgi:hypothetical protein